MVTNHYKHFDSLLARMISIVDRVGDALNEEEFDTSGETDTFSEHNSDIFSETSSDSDTDPHVPKTTIDPWIMPDSVLTDLVWNVCTPFDHTMKS
jgi:hypothetical protein